MFVEYKTDMYSVFLMNACISDQLTCMSLILSFLSVKDVARYRLQCRDALLDTFRSKGPWLNYIQRWVSVSKCDLCIAIRSVRRVDWCELCECWVCIDHLDVCDSCANVCCDQCVDICCQIDWYL